MTSNYLTIKCCINVSAIIITYSGLYLFLTYIHITTLNSQYNIIGTDVNKNVWLIKMLNLILHCGCKFIGLNLVLIITQYI